MVVRTGTGTVVIPGDQGEWRVVDAPAWRLAAEHNHWGRGWRPNTRVTFGPVTVSVDGGRSQELWSTDWDFDGHDPHRRNLVIRLEEIVATHDVPTGDLDAAGLDSDIPLVGGTPPTHPRQRPGVPRAHAADEARGGVRQWLDQDR